MHAAGTLEGFTFYEARVALPEEPTRYTFVPTEAGLRADPGT